MNRSVHATPALPYTPLPFPGEVLSSWLKRIATEFGVSLAYLTQHMGLSASTADLIDNGLTTTEIQCIAAVTRSNQSDIRKMVHRPIRSSVRTLITSQLPIQYCATCRANHTGTTSEPIAIKAWFEFWQIECEFCRIPFASAAKLNLRRGNPAREHPAWFCQLLPAARVGGRQLAEFARRPLGVELEPTAVLSLLSLQLGADAYSAVFGRQLTPESWNARHCIAELFIPELRERRFSDPLVPKRWTAREPVKLVTARTILFAAMATFFANARHSLRQIVSIANAAMKTVIDRWFLALPRHSRQFLVARR
jgi:TniQ